MFSVICFLESWATDNSICKDPNFQIENYLVWHQVRESDRGKELRIFVLKEVYFKPRKDLSIDSNDVESLCIEIHLKKDRNILLNVMYRPPNGDMTVFQHFCRKLLFANDKALEKINFAGNLNINVLGYESNVEVKYSLSSMFQYNLMSTWIKPTRVTRNIATTIYHITAKTKVSGIYHRSRIMKVDTLDPFTIAFALTRRWGTIYL